MINLSIVVPFYNVMTYAECMLDSILPVLTDNSIECILIEDFSSDGTREYLKKQEKHNRYPNVKYIFQTENKGLSAARNTGLKHAVGEYIWFIDSDDVLTEHSIKNLLEALMKLNKVDMLFFNFYFLYEEVKCPLETKNIKIKKTKQLFTSSKKYTREEFISLFFKNEKIYAWMFVAKKELYIDIQFPSGQYYEDISTTPKLIQVAETYSYIDQELLYYRQRSLSIMGNPSVKSCLDYASAMKSSIEFCKKRGITENTKIEMDLFYFKTLRWALNDLQDHRLLTKEVYNQYMEKNTQFFSCLDITTSQFINELIKRESKSTAITSLIYLMTPRVYMWIRGWKK